ncbi:MAG: DUF2959 domain-containing protein [Candidatus Hydrogenedentes bacterium]|nr:DUF2959 domain-containing protein [Candidatus Hydrogenedentota bacterium]
MIPYLRALACASILLAVVVSSSGCDTSSLYFTALEKAGWHKRDILIKRVVAARDSQEEAKEQFKDALEHFSAVLNFDGGVLEDKYNVLADELAVSEKRAQEVRDRVDAVEEVAEALFQEWESELQQYTDAGLRRASDRQLRETRRRYNDLIAAMKRAESKIDPVLEPFQDHVLFLKHNLNAKAIASLQDELGNVEEDVALLIQDMEASIAEANQFVKEMEENSEG